MAYLPTRHAFLDFHTSGLIPGVGSKFNPDEFVSTFKKAHVNYVGIMTKCHHGYCYYPSKIIDMHPGLNGFNLLGEQIKALEAGGIKYFLYSSFCWDELAARRNPGWLMRDKEGRTMRGGDSGILEPAFDFLCWNSPHRQYLIAQAVEVCEMFKFSEYQIDMIFTRLPGCCCQYCLDSMQRRGFDPKNDEDVYRHSIITSREFMEETSNAIWDINPGCKIWYNVRLRLNGNVDLGIKPEMKYCGMVLVECVSSGHWGYDYFPLYVRYLQNIEKNLFSHTARFHGNWAENGSWKNQAAMDFEVLRMVSYGVSCGIGDNYHPTGQLDELTYRIIGDAYEKVEKVEDYAYPTSPIDEIGLMLTNTKTIVPYNNIDLPSEVGALKMLMQLKLQFSVIDEESEFEKYRLIILPDEVIITPKLKAKLEEYVNNGGKILATGASGKDGDHFALDGMRLKFLGRNEFEPYYIFPKERFAKSIPDFEYFNYCAGEKIEVLDKSYEILAGVAVPYFNREWNHFCSHRQTPVEKRTDIPEMVYNNKNMIYMSSYIFKSYWENGNKVFRDFIENAINVLLPERIFASNLPSTAEVTVRRNDEGRGVVVNILNNILQRRVQKQDIMEDVIPLYNIKVSIKLDKPVSRVFSPQDGTEYKFKYSSGRIELVIPEISGYRMLVIQ